MKKTNNSNTIRAKEAFAFPQSFAQQRLWFLDRLEPGGAWYNTSAALRIAGTLNITVLRQCLKEIIRRHEALRTTFANVKGRLLQIVDPVATSRLSAVDLQGLPAAEREFETDRLAAAETRLPFDLKHGPLIRARLLDLGANEYIFLLTAHHIVFDGWSTAVFMDELTRLYEAYRCGEPSPLPELSIQYADFAVWQRQWLQGSVLEEQLTYWRKQLGSDLPVLELPTDHPRPAVPNFRGATQSFVLSETLARSLKTLGQKEGCTLFMTLLASFMTLLYRYTGQADICIGAPIAGRNRIETEKLIGFFVNTLVLRADLSDNPGFNGFLKRVRDTCLGAYAHQDLPFEKLVEDLQPERDISRAPLVQVTFDLRYPSTSGFQSQGLTSSFLETETGTSKFDLVLSMVESEQTLKGTWEYNTDLFSHARMSRMTKHFRALLEGIVADPGQALSELPLLTEPEVRLLLAEWNATTTDYPSKQCVHQLFEAQAADTPDATAVVSAPIDSGHGENKEVTYRELNCRANRLAHHLRTLGAGSEVLIAVYMERSPEMVTGLLAILKAGAAYLPIDTSLPNERLLFILDDAKPAILLTQQKLVPELPPTGARVLCLDTDRGTVDARREENPLTQTSVDNLAYLIYTSGSTGRPKGTLITHRGLVNYLSWCKRTYPLKDGQGVPVYSSIAFDLTVTSLFSPLLTGRAATLLPEEAGVEALGDILQSDGHFSLVKATPSHLLLLKHLTTNSVTGTRPRAMIIGGENLSAEDAAIWQDIAPGSALFNEYGPTETVVGSCVYRVPPEEAQPGSIPIGRPIANTQIYLLDANEQLVPIGVPGELYIGGAGLARGYFNQAGLSAERFLPNPFGSERGTRLFKTGDLARFLPDGNIEFLGRLDNQVKIRGFRVELGEIEAVLSRHPAVEQAAVVVREEAQGGSLPPVGKNSHLIAYFVPAGDLPPKESDLLPFLKARLPDYMIPSVFVMLGALPMTPSGKVDRKALPAPNGRRPELQGGYVPPRSEMERNIAAIWREALGVDRIGMNDSFFDLGGHSLLIVQVHNRLKDTYTRSISVIDMFKYPTISSLAEYLSQEEVEPPSDDRSKRPARSLRAAAQRQRTRRQRNRGRV
jgi:amino acid adenylation domain-containing protein